MLMFSTHHARVNSDIMILMINPDYFCKLDLIYIVLVMTETQLLFQMG